MGRLHWLLQVNFLFYRLVSFSSQWFNTEGSHQTWVKITVIFVLAL